MMRGVFEFNEVAEVKIMIHEEIVYLYYPLFDYYGVAFPN